VERVNLTACNKKNVESLALAGAFDNFPEISREQYFAETAKGELFLETLMRYGNKYQLDKNSSMNSLFGGMDTVEIARPEAPKTEPWSNIERLNKEKELVGIYLSSHPLDDYYIALNYVCNLGMKDFDEAKTSRINQPLTFGGIVTAYREGTTRNGKPYGVIRLEDFTGSGEIPLFGKDYIEYSKYGRPNIYLLIKGIFAPSAYDPNRINLSIASIDLLNEKQENLVEKLTIRLPLYRLDEELIEDLAAMAKNRPGKTKIGFQIEDNEQQLSLSLAAEKDKYEIPKSMVQYLEDKELSFAIN
jgi:DNA polymerase-3 subunit alpha